MRTYRLVVPVLFAAGLVAALLMVREPVLALKLGDPAPPLQIATWVKGEPVDLAAGKGKNVFVVEFWATWCPPCRQSIPHLTELQAQYKPKGVIFVGVSVEDLNTVKPFVEQMGGKMAYTVAVDKDNKTSAAYMEAFDVKGIPHAFVIDKTGAIVSHGHPMAGLDRVLDRVLAGSFDWKKEGNRDETLKALMKQAHDYFSLAQDGTDTKSADELANKLTPGLASEPQLANEVAWTILTADGLKYRDLKFALNIAKAAVDASGGKDAAIMDTYARALFDNGKVADAIAAQKKAIELAQGRDDLIKELQKSLEKYQSKAGPAI